MTARKTCRLFFKFWLLPVVLIGWTAAWVTIAYKHGYDIADED